MAGTVTITEERFGSVQKVVFAWLCDAAGAADATTTYPYAGEVRRLVTVPGSAGAAPTALYDIRILDGDSTDILMGGGADRSATVTEQVQGTSLGIIAHDTMTLEVRNAGNAKSGTAYVYLKR